MGTRLKYEKCHRKRTFGPKGPDDYLSPEDMRKLMERKPKDAKADHEWRKGMLLSIRANEKRR